MGDASWRPVWVCRTRPARHPTRTRYETSLWRTDQGLCPDRYRLRRWDQLLIPHRPRRRRATLDLVAGRRRDLQARLAQHPADRFDTAEPLPMFVDELDYLGSRGSSSRAKKPAAAFRISLARRSSRTSRSSSAIRCESTVDVPRRLLSFPSYRGDKPLRE